MMIWKFLKYFLPFSIAVLPVRLSAEQPLEVKLNLAPGESFLCTMEMSQKVTQTIDDENQVLEQDMILSWDYTVLEKDENGNYKIQATYVRTRSKQQMGLQSVEYDSDLESEYVDPSMLGFKAMVGAKLYLTVTDDGKVIELSGVEEIFSRLWDELKIADYKKKNDMIDALRSQFGDEAMRQSFEQMTAFYPDGPVVTGDSWNNDISVDTGFPMFIESDFTLQSRENGISTIELSAKIDSNLESGGIGMGLFSLTYDITGTQSGYIKLDEVSGLPVQSNIRQAFSGTVSISETPELGEKSWPISADGEIEITFERQ